MSPADATLAQQLSQPGKTDVAENLLFDEVLPQLGQRPLVHANQHAGRREGDLGDLFGQLGSELPRSARDVEGGIRDDPLDAIVIETVEDRPHPSGRAIDQPGDLPVLYAASREEDDAGVTAIDLIAQLPFQPPEFLVFPRAKRPCLNAIHDGVSVFGVSESHDEVRTRRLSPARVGPKMARITAFLGAGPALTLPASKAGLAEHDGSRRGPEGLILVGSKDIGPHAAAEAFLPPLQLRRMRSNK